MHIFDLQVANELDVPRIGPQHQAGSDSLLTGQTFFKMKEMFFEDDIDDSKYCGHLFGLGTNFVVCNSTASMPALLPSNFVDNNKTQQQQQSNDNNGSRASSAESEDKKVTQQQQKNGEKEEDKNADSEDKSDTKSNKEDNEDNEDQGLEMK